MNSEVGEVTPAFETPPTINLPEVGSCIYCGSPYGELTKEHIIPSGINGYLILPKSTCKKCQKITSLIEQKVLRGFLYNSRLTLGMRSSGPRYQLPKTIKIKFLKHGGGSFKKKVPLTELRTLLMLPMFVEPKFLKMTESSVATNGVEVMAVPNGLDNVLQPLARSYGAAGVQYKVSMEITPFVKMLAKIAYAYHVAIRGVFPREESPALAVMFGERSDMGTWVGCKDHIPINGHNSVWHDIGFEDVETTNGNQCTLVHISLFDQYRPCTYTVVTRTRNWKSVLIGDQ